MNQENSFYVEVKPVITYPKCYITGEIQDCPNCDLYKQNICNSPIGKCMSKYPGRKNGCPNYGKKANCPPNLPTLDYIFDQNEPIFAVYSIFDLKDHELRMRLKHPEWSDKQCRNSLFWQGSAKKKMKDRAIEFMKIYKNKGYVLVESPETFGVDVTETMSNVGIHLEWPVRDNVYRINFAGILSEEMKKSNIVNNRRYYMNELGYMIFEVSE